MKSWVLYTDMLPLSINTDILPLPINKTVSITIPNLFYLYSPFTPDFSSGGMICCYLLFSLFPYVCSTLPQVQPCRIVTEIYQQNGRNLSFISTDSDPLLTERDKCQ